MKFNKLTPLLFALLLVFGAQAKSKKSESHIADKSNKQKLWIWMNPSQKAPERYYDSLYTVWRNYGVTGVFLEADVEKAFRSAKKHGLEAHRWMWTMNRGDILKQHPEFAAVSRNGKSTVDAPPYVDYYRWMCPTHPGVAEALKKEVESLCKKDYIDGIHLDYVRYCDVILPFTLWKNYGIEQQLEHGEYDFCYCDRCRKLYAEKYGVDPLTIKYPDQALSWRAFRYEQVVNIVNEVCKVAHTYKKPVSAAVFPTPEVARRLVRQDWVRFPIDAVCPMVYHSFYDEQPAWIKTAVKEGVDFMDGKKPLYAGLFLEGFKNIEELKEGVKMAIEGGANGVSLYSIPTLEQLKAVQSALKETKK